MTEDRIRSRDAAATWRDTRSGSVVFTNGVFDLLHPGHIHVIETARKLGDSIIVGINTDRSAATLGKGTGRPVVSEGDRARVVASLAAVDCVVLFDEDTPARLIEQLRPDVLVKGMDYAAVDLPGAAWVEAHGGRVELVPTVESISSSNIVERIRRGKI